MVRSTTRKRKRSSVNPLRKSSKHNPDKRNRSRRYKRKKSRSKRTRAAGWFSRKNQPVPLSVRGRLSKRSVRGPAHRRVQSRRGRGGKRVGGSPAKYKYKEGVIFPLGTGGKLVQGTIIDVSDSTLVYTLQNTKTNELEDNIEHTAIDDSEDIKKFDTNKIVEYNSAKYKVIRSQLTYFYTIEYINDSAIDWDTFWANLQKNLNDDQLKQITDTTPSACSIQRKCEQARDLKFFDITRYNREKNTYVKPEKITIDEIPESDIQKNKVIDNK